jgi:hypothetical protein
LIEQTDIAVEESFDGPWASGWHIRGLAVHPDQSFFNRIALFDQMHKRAP